MTKVAFVGLGAMGLRMSMRLAKAEGIELSVYDVNTEQAGKMAGEAKVAKTLGEAVDGADVIFSVVPADRHTLAVIEEYLPSAEAGQTFVDFSTIGPSTIEDVGARLKSHGVETISAGMTKSIEGATNGTLSLFLGGPAKIPAKIRPAFDAIATDLMMVGSLGAAKAIKLVNNMVVATLDVAITEAMSLGRQFGFRYEEVTDALSTQGGDSWPLHNHIVAHVLPNDLGPGYFSTRFLIKDMKLYCKFASGLDLPALFAGVTLSEYRGTCAIGYSDDYHMIVLRWQEHAAAIGSRAPTPLPEGRARDAVLKSIVAGVVAVQSLVSAEAIKVMGVMGVVPKDAAFFLESGSAGNDSMRNMVAALDGTAEPIRLSAVRAALDDVLVLADAADVPCTMFEIARQITSGACGAHGADASVWSIAGV